MVEIMVQKPKVIVFIDGSNIYFAQKKMGKWLDWVKVKQYLERHQEVIEIRYYAGLRKRDSKMRSFLRKLRKIGFKVITKPVKCLLDEQGHFLEKANFDIKKFLFILLAKLSLGNLSLRLIAIFSLRICPA